MYQEIIVKNPNLVRKFGWGWSCQPTGRDAYSIETPDCPDITGTINQCMKYANENRTFKSIKSGGTFYNTAWFYDGKLIVATWAGGLLKYADDLPYPDDIDDDDFDYQSWDRANSLHHLDNDVYGYAWFNGLILDSQLWENGELKIRVIGDTPDDLITQSEAVDCGAPSIQAVNNAIRDNRLRGYSRQETGPARQGATLVSAAAVKNLWPKIGD